MHAADGTVLSADVVYRLDAQRPAIDVETTYFQALPWRDGAFEMVVPTVVGPRF